MLDVSAQSRLAKCTSDAMFGYMAATTAASVAMTEQVLSFWASAARSMTGEPATPPRRSAEWPAYPWAMTSGMQNPAMAAFPGFSWPMTPPASAMMQPFDLWLSFTPFGRSPMVLGMAFTMMNFGVPRSVAMPAAEASAATLKAAEIVTAPARRNYSAYRSEGGHASAQIAEFGRLVAPLMLLPMTGSFALWPWLSTPRAFGF
ncbi:MAG: hypothetical protein ACT4N2_01930 [Hyphomicrobium sp.]